MNEGRSRAPSPVSRAVLPAETAALNRAIAACRREGAWLQAIAFLHDSGQAHLEPDIVTYNSTISVLRGQWRRAFVLLEDLESHLQADVITVSSAIKCCEHSCWLHALLVLDDHASNSLQADIIAYSSIVSVCEKARQWCQALCVLEKLLQPKLRADATRLQKAVLFVLFCAMVHLQSAGARRCRVQ